MWLRTPGVVEGTEALRVSPVWTKQERTRNQNRLTLLEQTSCIQLHWIHREYLKIRHAQGAGAYMETAPTRSLLPSLHVLSIPRAVSRCQNSKSKISHFNIKRSYISKAIRTSLIFLFPSRNKALQGHFTPQPTSQTGTRAALPAREQAGDRTQVWRGSWRADAGSQATPPLCLPTLGTMTSQSQERPAGQDAGHVALSSEHLGGNPCHPLCRSLETPGASSGQRSSWFDDVGPMWSHAAMHEGSCSGFRLCLGHPHNS